MTKPLAFTTMPLERCGNERKNSQWIDQQSTHPQAKFLVSYRSRILLFKEDVAYLSVEHASVLKNIAGSIVFLGLLKGEKRPIFIFDVSAGNEVEILSKIGQQTSVNPYGFYDLRSALSMINASDAAIAGYGNALVHWQRSHTHCGYCGSNSASVEGGHARKCLNIECEKIVFPRTDPVVIMLVEHTNSKGEKRCLLAGHQRTSGQVISTLAGFVDPGESIEEAVKREIFEEVGLHAKSVEYITSQPWPFPASLMLGFYVQVTDDETNIDPNEITHVKWCSADQIQSFDDWGADNGNIEIPGEYSIARYLIDWWCNTTN